MSKNNQGEKQEMTISDLAQEMRERFSGLEGKVTNLDAYTRQGFETMNQRADGLEEEFREFRQEARGRFDDLDKGLFTEEEKEEVMAMVRHYDRWLETDAKGTNRITLTREEYDATSFARGFPNRFDRLAAIEVE